MTFFIVINDFSCSVGQHLVQWVGIEAKKSQSKYAKSLNLDSMEEHATVCYFFKEQYMRLLPRKIA